MPPWLCALGYYLSGESEVLCTLDQVFIKDISVLCSVQLSLSPDQSPAEKHSANNAATTMLHRWNGIGQVMSGAWFPLDMMLRIEAKQFNLAFIRPENLHSHSLRVL